MSSVLAASEICGEALGAIGAFPVTETAPDPQHLRRAMTWLDMLLAEWVGTDRFFSRIAPGTLGMLITNGTQSYDLFAVLGANLPADSIQYIVDVWVEDALGNRTPVDIVDQQRFEDVSKPADTGPPAWIFIDRVEAAPTLRIYPTPAASDTTVYTLKMIVQRFAPNVAPTGVLGTKPSGSILHGMGQAWQRTLVCQLAHDLGAGPIHKLAEPSLSRFAAMAATSKQRLLAFENRAHDTTPPVCAAWGL
jgi:hypothetical protein